jgi:hypothetical protein
LKQELSALLVSDKTYETEYVMIDELDAKTKAKVELEAKKLEYVLQYGNRLQKIIAVSGIGFALRMLWISRWKFKGNWVRLIPLTIKDDIYKAKLIWERKVLA